MSLQRAIASLCGNPRQFKQALRTFLESWRNLAGEVDIDEVLMLSALAVASPKIVELVNTHINSLRAGAPFEKDKEKLSRFAQEVVEELKHSETTDPTALRFVLSELFPEWEKGPERRNTPKRPQGFAQTHTDYWLRYWSQVPPEPRASDQRMLRLIDEWREREPGELPHVMMSGEHPDSLEALLASRLEGADLLRLLEDVVTAEFKTGRHNWGDGSTKGDPPALVSVWRMMLRAKPDSQGLLDMLRKRFRTILPTNVALAWELIYFFGTSESQVEPVLDPDRVTALGQEFRREIGVVFKGQPGALIDALRGAEMHVFYWSLWGLENVRAHRTQGVPDSWSELVDTVVEAVKRAPEVMIPQILPFVVKVHQGIDWSLTRRRPQQFTKFEWDRDSTERLFGVSRFEAMIRGHAEPKLGSEDAQAMLAAVYSGLAVTRS